MSEKRVIEVESCKACPNVEHKWDNERDCLVYRCNEIPDKEESNHLYAEVNPAEIPANCPLPLANKKEGELEEAQKLLVGAERSHTSNPEEKRRFLKGYGAYVRKYKPKYKSFEPG